MGIRHTLLGAVVVQFQEEKHTSLSETKLAETTRDTSREEEEEEDELRKVGSVKTARQLLNHYVFFYNAPPDFILLQANMYANLPAHAPYYAVGMVCRRQVEAATYTTLDPAPVRPPVPRPGHGFAPPPGGSLSLSLSLGDHQDAPSCAPCSRLLACLFFLWRATKTTLLLYLLYQCAVCMQHCLLSPTLACCVFLLLLAAIETKWYGFCKQQCCCRPRLLVCVSFVARASKQTLPGILCIL